MTNSSPKDFFAKAQDDAGLLSKLMPLLATLQDPNAEDSTESINGIINLASQYEYTFSTEQLDQFFADLSGESFRASLAGELELSDYDLELVAGGKAALTVTTVTTALATMRGLCS
mgnify:CR=1 FL=1